MSLDLLRGVCVSINRLNGKITDMITEVDNLEKEKKVLEFRLQQLGVTADRIQEAGEVAGREYCRTSEREKVDEENAKRKREKEVEEEAAQKRIRIIPTIDGKYRRSYELEGQEVEAEGDMEEKVDEVVVETAEEKHLKLLTTQQSDILKSQAKMLQHQQQEIEFQAANIRMLKEEREKKDRMQKEKEKGKKETNVKQEVIDVDESVIKDEPKASTSSEKSGKIEDMVRKELLRFLPKYQSGVGVSSTTEKEGSSTTTSQISSEQTPATNVYVTQPTKDQNIILLQPTQQNVKSTERRSGKTHPVPIGRRKLHKHYCENCKSEFSRKDQLTQHVKNDCLQPICQFICDACNAGYYSEKAVREHYYKIHLKTFLYYCTKCNHSFFHLSRKSSHKGKCPNPKGEDVYAARAPYNDELEKTFKRRTIMPVKITEQQQQQQQQPIEGQQKLIEGDKEQIQEVQQPVEGDPQEAEGNVQQQEGEPQLIEGDEEREIEQNDDDDGDDGDDDDDDDDDENVRLENVGKINPEAFFPESYPLQTNEDDDATQLLLQMAQGGIGLNQPDVGRVEAVDKVVEPEILEVENMDKD